MTMKLMNSKITLGLFVLTGWATLSLGAIKPNIVFIMADDLGPGWVDYEGTNPEINTPNLERLANSGMVFTRAYAAEKRAMLRSYWSSLIRPRSAMPTCSRFSGKAMTRRRVCGRETIWGLSTDPLFIRTTMPKKKPRSSRSQPINPG